MKEILFALLAGGLGSVLLFGGYKLARIIIPLWAFFAGFGIAAAGVADATGEGFLGTTLGIVVGLIMGFVFALFSYFFYSLAVVLLGATAGYWVGTGMLSLIGIDKGFVSATIGIVMGVIFAIATLTLNAAKYLLIFLTSFAGSIAIIGGILVLFGQIELSSFDYITARETINNSWIWVTANILLFTFGIAAQTLTNKDYVLDSWTTEYGAPKSKTTYIDGETK